MLLNNNLLVVIIAFLGGYFLRPTIQEVLYASNSTTILLIVGFALFWFLKNKGINLENTKDSQSNNNNNNNSKYLQ